MTAVRRRIARNAACLFLAFAAIAGCHAPVPPPAVYLLTANVHEQCMQTLRQGMLQGDPETVIHAAEALTGARYTFDVQPVLLDLLTVVKDAPVRAGLIGELVRSGYDGSIVLLQDMLLGQNMESRLAAARTLFTIGRVGDTLLLQEAMKEGEDGRLRVYAAAALQRSGRGETLGFIRSRALSDDPIVRGIAADVLLQLGEASDIPLLNASLELARYDADRYYVERALAVLGDPAGRAALYAQLSSNDSVTRSQAARAAAEAWLVDGASQLYAMLNDPVLDVRVRAAHALLILSDPESPQFARRVHLDRK
ncbi:MAG: HEAT repeat domain-containing protein [Rhodothermales bacterium]